MNKWLAKSKHAVGAVRDFLDEKYLHSAEIKPLSRLHRFAHFWLLVGKSFNRNRCPARASALAYTTLLAIVPVLFVVVSVSTSFLRQEGGQRVTHFIDRILVKIALPVTANKSSIQGTNADEADLQSATNSINSTNKLTASSQTNILTASSAAENTNNAGSISTNTISVRSDLIHNINEAVQNIQSGTLGVTGIAGLIVVAILMLRSIESTFNDIWGVARGRTWWAQIMQYSAVLLLGPMFLAVGLVLTGSSHLQSTKEFLEHAPFVGGLIFKIVPVVLLCLAFSIFYVVMPNTKVHWGAALFGGTVGGVLWHLNNYFSVLYVSRWVTNSKIYGSLAIIPIFMAGLYISWLILLFGAQVAYAWQNRIAYLQEKQTENVNQRGREFVALRLMECVGKRFQNHEPPATLFEIADCLAVPTRLVQQILQTLLAARLVVEVSGDECAYSPGRPLEQITCHDILIAMRSGQGQELATRDEPSRAGVYGEFQKIMEAEQRAASVITLRFMVDRSAQLKLTSKPTESVVDGESEKKHRTPNIEG